MKYALIAAIVLMSWGQPAAAQGVDVFGYGARSCGAWTEARRTGGSSQRYQREQWVSGYVTAANRYLGNLTGGIGGIDYEGLMGWIDNYCRDNPTMSLHNAARYLVKFLKNR